jgi:hypothetical protein
MLLFPAETNAGTTARQHAVNFPEEVCRHTRLAHTLDTPGCSYCCCPIIAHVRLLRALHACSVLTAVCSAHTVLMASHCRQCTGCQEAHNNPSTRTIPLWGEFVCADAVFAGQPLTVQRVGNQGLDQLLRCCLHASRFAPLRFRGWHTVLADIRQQQHSTRSMFSLLYSNPIKRMQRCCSNMRMQPPSYHPRHAVLCKLPCKLQPYIMLHCNMMSECPSSQMPTYACCGCITQLSHMPMPMPPLLLLLIHNELPCSNELERRGQAHGSACTTSGSTKVKASGPAAVVTARANTKQHKG